MEMLGIGKMEITEEQKVGRLRHVVSALLT